MFETKHRATLDLHLLDTFVFWVQSALSLSLSLFLSLSLSLCLDENTSLPSALVKKTICLSLVFPCRDREPSSLFLRTTR